MNVPYFPAQEALDLLRNSLTVPLEREGIRDLHVY